MPAVAKLEEPQLQKVSFRRILFATDFSEASQRALPYAIAIARHYGSAISIVHALGREPRISVPLEATPRELDRPLIEAEREMKQLAKDVHLSEILHSTTVAHGPVWDVLASIIQREKIDLLVVGTHGRGGVKKLVLGSVAEQVLRRALCPVLTIGKNVALGGLPFQSILFATDFGRPATHALPYAVSLAEEYGSELTLLHMVPPTPVLQVGLGAFAPAPYAAEELGEWQDAARKLAARKLHQLAVPETRLAHKPEYVVGSDFVPEGILEAGARCGADLIVMGANRTSSAGTTAHMPWTVAHTLVCQAACPVLTVAG
jgi:nucleotide-binding universal stress UspA family protein